MGKRRFHLTVFSILFFLHILSISVHAQVIIWANEGGDKVSQDELRAANDASSVINSVWDGQKITVFAARNEVVSFNLILEAPGTVQLLNSSELTVGTHTFYFGVDMNMNGSLDMDFIYYDSLSVKVTRP